MYGNILYHSKASLCWMLHSSVHFSLILTLCLVRRLSQLSTISSTDQKNMRLLSFFAIPLCFAAPAFSNLADSLAKVLADEQQAVILNQECTTRTKMVTRTRYEVNVVSTVYRYRNHATPTPNAQLEGTESTVVFGVEGTGCDQKACSICRMLNNCSNEEENW